ncbi:MAG: hypothetical protein KGN84_19870, partial [Acidobacteriota bacterium]|nr:hypothetical protein [Acidobacteriota bacterium]
MKRCVSLLLLASSLAYAQAGYVSNAIGTRFSAFNTLAPAMLATLAPPILGIPVPNPGVPALQSAPALQLFILPANSTAAIPITNVFGLNFVVPAGVP